MTLLQDFIITVRGLRKDNGVEEKVSVPIQVKASPGIESILATNVDKIQRLARVSALEFVSQIEESSSKRGAVNFDVAILYKKQIDVSAERERLTKELSKFEKEMESKQSQLQNQGFLAKAPAKVVDGLRARAEELTVLIEKARTSLESLDGIGGQ